MSKLGTSYEHVMKNLWAKYKQVNTTETWASHEQVMKKLRKIYLGNKSTQKNLVSKNIFGLQNFYSKKNQGQKTFGPK